MQQSASHAPSGFSMKLGQWAHGHRELFTSSPVGYLPYQFVRSAIASIPYGIIGGAVYVGARRLFPDALIKHPTTFASGMAAAAQIGASFTFYRTFSKACKNVHNDIFNEHNSEADTIKAVGNMSHTFWNSVADSLPVEASSVPWAALTLGLITAHGAKFPEAIAASGKGWADISKWHNVATHPNAKVLQNSLVNTVAYSTFFEVADRLGKDYKIRKDTWVGAPNTLISGKSDEEAKAPSKYDFFTKDPSVGRLLFRRVLPVAVGISAYTVAKRFGYKMAGGFPDPAQSLLTNIWREGFATSMFFTLLGATEPYEKAYDNFFARLSAGEGEKRPVTQEQIALFDKVNAKEQGASASVLH